MRHVEDIIAGPARRQARELFYDVFKRQRPSGKSSGMVRRGKGLWRRHGDQCIARGKTGNRCGMLARIGFKTCWGHRAHEPVDDVGARQ